MGDSTRMEGMRDAEGEVVHDLKIIGTALWRDDLRCLPETLGEPGTEEPHIALVCSHVEVKGRAENYRCRCCRVIHDDNPGVALFH